jgi:hypothetical protein
MLSFDYRVEGAMKRLGFALAVASACGLSAAAQAEEAATVTLTPQAGFTVQIPKGWKACDEATDKLLGAADDTLLLGKQACPAAAGMQGMTVTVYSPTVGFTATVMIGYADQSPVTPEVVNSLTPEMLTQVRDALRKEREVELAKLGSKIDDMAVRTDKIAGHSALVTTILQTPKQGALAQVYTEVWEIPVGGHMHQVSFVWPKLLESNTKPALDAIKASIKIASP